MRKALFLHIQKTAGTSIQVMARHAYGNDGVCSHADFLSLGQAGCARYPFLSGHFGFSFARPLMADRYCFTVLRDPIDRLVSLYVFCRSRPPEDHFLYRAAGASGFGAFLALADDWPYRHALWNNITWQLSYGWGHSLVTGRRLRLDDVPAADLLARAVENLATFDHVGFVDRFDDDVATIFTHLGAPSLDPVRENVMTSSDEHLTLRQQEAGRLLDMTVLDRALYDHARRHVRPADPPGGIASGVKTRVD